MIKIRSTEKLATSNSNGLCDIERTMLSFKFDLEKGLITTIIEDKLFQEVDSQYEDDEGNLVNYKKRNVIEIKKPAAYNFSINEIDYFYSIIGSDITKEVGFTNGLNKNLESVLIAQTIEAERHTMKNWIIDK